MWVEGGEKANGVPPGVYLLCDIVSHVEDSHMITFKIP